MEKGKIRSIVFTAIGLTTIVAVGWMIKSYFWGNDNGYTDPGNNNKTAEKNYPQQQRILLQQDQLLHEYLNGLQKLDMEYYGLLTDTIDNDKLTTLNAKIVVAEKYFSQSLDSISKNPPEYTNPADENFFINMISSFRLSLDDRRSMNDLRSTFSSDSISITDDQKSMLLAKSEMTEKDKRITYLERMISSMQVSEAPAPASKKNREMNETAPGNEALIAEKENKIASLSAANANMQKDYDRLLKLQNEASKNISYADYKTKTLSMQKEIIDLNTELALAQVDCNLSRADATQIISNSKQRKVLLTEALNILNNLSSSENPETQKKVQNKIARLNRVATNYRD
ncbi:hypothetical protein BH11BAC3_BH11BAC3_40200 [soil metagenome]